MTTRVCPPAQGCRELDVGGHRYKVRRDGTFHVADEHAAAAVKGAECFIPAAGGVLRAGVTWLCECGWRARINSCPKCKRTDLTKETC